MNEYKIMEDKIKTLLQKYAINEYAKDSLSALIAKKSLKMHHMYEDLGFENRIQMGHFMYENFTNLAKKKPKDKLWKKFLYDEIDMIAPACISCSYQSSCFSCTINESSS